MNVWGTSLLKFYSIEIICCFANWMVITFQDNFDKLLNTVVKKSGTCNGVFLNKTRFLLPIHSFNVSIGIIFTNFPNILNKSIHLVSAEENYPNHVGRPNCLIIANTYFFRLFSRYAEEFLKVFKIKYPSSSLTISLTVDGLRTSLAVHFCPLIYNALIQG